MTRLENISILALSRSTVPTGSSTGGPGAQDHRASGGGELASFDFPVIELTGVREDLRLPCPGTYAGLFRKANTDAHQPWEALL